MDSGDFEARLEKLEMALEVSEELMVEKLAEFERRLCSLEKVHTADVQALREDLEILSRSAPTGSGFDPSGGSTMYTKELLDSATEDREEFQVPMKLDDVRDDVRELIKDFVPGTLDVKEKLSPVQCAYVNYWVNDRKLEYVKKGIAIALREDGISAAMWNPGWKPNDITVEFEAYLQEKIKYIIKKGKKSAMKASLKRRISDESS